MTRPHRTASRQIGDRPHASSTAPALTDEGVMFHMTYQGKTHEILTPTATLQGLCESQDPALNLITAFQQHRARIQGVAGRILSARGGVSPVVLKSEFFR